jgi:hypothetical protein
MAKMEKDHDPSDLLALLVLEQYRTSGTGRLHHHLRSGSESLTGGSVAANFLPNSRLRHWHACNSSDVSQVWPSTYLARKYRHLPCLTDRLLSMHFLWSFDGMSYYPGLV